MRRFAWVVALACTLGCGATITAQRPVTTDTNWKEFAAVRDLPPGAMAITECKNGRPVVYFSPAVPDSIYEELWSHERVHVEALVRPDETCEEIHARTIADPAALLNHEADAYCSQAKWVMAHRENIDPLAGLIDLGNKVAAYFGHISDPRFHVPQPIIVALFIRKCPEVLNP